MPIAVLATTDSTYLADALRAGTVSRSERRGKPVEAVPVVNDSPRSVELFQQMMAHRRAGGATVDG